MAREGRSYEQPIERRELPELSVRPSWRALLERAFAANGELESAYFDWRSAVERVTIAAGYPSTNLAPSFSYMLSGSGMTAWDRTTVEIGLERMQGLPLPAKVRTAGKLELERARAAGARFVTAKFALQRRTLDTWLDLALLEERQRIQVERLALERQALGTVAQSAALGGDAREPLRAEVAVRRAELDLDDLRAAERAKRAELDALLVRASDSPLALATTLPEARAVPASDEELLSVLVEHDPELDSMQHAVIGGEQALELARLEYLPDFNPFVGFTGSVEQMLGVGVSLPTRLPQIRAGIEEARALLSGARATLRQATLDARARGVAALAMLRFSERQASVLSGEIAALVERTAELAVESYATGRIGFVELLEAQRARLDLRDAVADARIERERRVAELEQLMGVDMQTLTLGPNDERGDTEVDRHE